MKKVISKNLNRNPNITDSKLCAFSSLDYIVLASTLAVALCEELSSYDVNILATFFAVLSDDLALIAAVEACSSNGDEDETFTAPTPDVAITRTKANKSHSKNNSFKRKVVKKRIKRKKTLD